MKMPRIRGAHGALSAVVFASLCIMAVTEPAHAAKMQLDSKTAAEKVSAVLAKKEPQPTASSSAVSSSDQVVPPNCERSRKKLWVEDQGWVVRRVTTCY
jgi:hypothetical protein